MIIQRWTGAEIVDPVIPMINNVIADYMPAVRSPWGRYAFSSEYREIVDKIRDKKAKKEKAYSGGCTDRLSSRRWAKIWWFNIQVRLRYDSGKISDNGTDTTSPKTPCTDAYGGLPQVSQEHWLPSG